VGGGLFLAGGVVSITSANKQSSGEKE
jgi:hypothetical protein